MKIAICQHFEMDYLGETATVGLYEAGHNIYELPYLQHLRKDGVDKDYILFNGKLGYTGISGYLSNNPLPSNEHSEEEILDLAPTFDVVVVHSCRPYAIAALEKIVRRLERLPEHLIMMDGEDHDLIPWELIEKFRPSVFFKRELIRGKSPVGYIPAHNTHVMPLPFGAFTRSLPPDMESKEKELDIFLSLGMTHPCRKILLAKLLEYGITRNLRHWIATNSTDELYQLPYGNQFKDMLGWIEYMRKQARSEVTAVIRGHGRDTLHAWESMMAGVAMVYADPGIYIPYPLENGKHCLYFREDCADLEFQIDRLFHEPELRESLARESKAWCFEKHTTKARAEYMLTVAQKIWGGQRIEMEEFGIEGNA